MKVYLRVKNSLFWQVWITNKNGTSIDVISEIIFFSPDLAANWDIEPLDHE